jgi:hypothetical protein
MASYKCLWCDASIDKNLSVCPECNYENPEQKRRTRHGSRIAVGLAVLVVPLMISLAFAAQREHNEIVAQFSPTAASAVVVAPQRVVTFADPVQQASWVNGRKSLGQLFGQRSYTAFMSTGAGKVVSLCGSVQGTTGYQSRSGRQRYVSVFGRLDGTVLETQDPSFQVLWARVCKGSGSVA